MSDYGSITRQIQQLQSSDEAQRDAATQTIYDRYCCQLLQIAGTKLYSGVRRRADEHDVVQDAFASFCQRQQRGDFTLDSRSDLMRLLITITVRKARNVNQHHQAQQRDHRQERAEVCVNAEGSLTSWLLQQMDSSQPTPLEAAILREEFSRHLEMLRDDVRRAVVLCWIEGCTQEEAAGRLNCSLRSVARRLQLARDTWGRQGNDFS